MTARSANRFVEKLQDLVDYYRAEYDVTYAEIIGSMAIVSTALQHECLGISEADDVE